MKHPKGYEAVWAPGADTDFDRDTAIRLGYRWLGDTEELTRRRGAVIVNVMRNADHLPPMPRQWEVVTRRSRGRSGVGPMLAVWPTAETLELAEQLSGGYGLCVVPWLLDEMRPWIRRTGARCLVDGYDVEDLPAMAEVVTKELDWIVTWDGNNDFHGASGKPLIVPRLREIAAMSDRPTPQQVEEYVAMSGEVSSDGAKLLRRWYEEILAGTRHRTYRGERIP